MKKMKYVIILLAIILTILIIILVVALNKKEERLEIRDIPNESKIALEKETNIANFMQVNEFINAFYSYIKEEDTNIQNRLALYSVLDEEYKQTNNITEKNVLEIFSQYKNMLSYSTKNMYVEQYLQQEEYVNLFFYVEGIVRMKTGTEPVYIIVKQDLINDTYAIQFTTQEEFNFILRNGYIEETTIKNTEYNKMTVKTIADYDVCTEHMRDYKSILKTNIAEAYDLLDEEYREKRFGSLENFKQDMMENVDMINRVGFTEYATNKQGEYIQYICKDNYGYTYVFTEKYPMQYTVQLDTYSIETKEYIEKYNKASEEEKAKVNVQKFILMINNQDYINAYEKLDDKYKQTYFKTQEDLKNYVKKNMFKYNNISLKKSEKVGDIYIFTVSLTDLTNGIYKDADKEKKEGYQYRMIIKLLEGTDFVMSFNIE